MSASNDLRYAWRLLRRSPGFAFASILTLALGIGATTTMFSVVDQVLLHAVTYPDASRLVSVYEANRAGAESAVSLPDVRGWQARSHTLESIAYYTFAMPVLGGIPQPHPTAQLITSTDFFHVLGVQPRLGRAFAPGEDHGGATRVLVLGADTWHSLFHGDPAVVGRAVTLNGQSYTVIGVMPDGFRFQGGGDFVFSPLDTTLKDLQARDSGMLQVIARLREGVSLGEATRELNGLQHQDRRDFPASEGDTRVIVEGYAHRITGTVRPGLLALQGLIAAVWLLATINVAGLMLTRAQVRRREIAVRAALGAGRGRLLRQFLAESLLLGAAGAAAGLLITMAALRLSRLYLANTFMGGDLVRIDARVFLYAAFASLLSALLFGVLPALEASRRPILPGLREGSAASGSSRSQRVARDGIVVAELALSLLLLAAAGVMMQTLYRVQQEPLGFDPSHAVTAELFVPRGSNWFESSGAASAPNVVVNTIDPMLARIQALPGVTAVGVTTVRPLRTNWSFVDQVVFAGRPKPDPRHPSRANLRAASPGYFRAMGLSLRRGRLFSGSEDGPSTPIAAIVNEAFTREIDGAAAPVGMQVEIADKGPRRYATIVGVVSDARQAMDQSVAPELLLDLDQLTPADDFYSMLAAFHLDLVARTRSSPAALIDAIPRIAHGLAPDMAVDHVEPLQSVVDDTMGSRTLAERMMLLFGLAALAMAVAGIYGLLAYQVSQRMRDFGVRLALGAQRSHLLWMVLQRALLLLVAGGAAGVVLSLTVARIAGHAMAQVQLGSLPLILEGALGVLAITCIAAAYIPAARAAYVDPVEALRHE